MECECECEGCEGELVETVSIRIKKARKKHQCCECERAIFPGEEYEDAILRDYTDRVHFKTCIGCMRLQDSIGCCLGGVLNGAVQECFGVSIIEGVK